MTFRQSGGAGAAVLPGSSRSIRPRLLVVGLGNSWRGDDCLGLLAAREIKALNLPGLAVREVTGDLTALLDLWDEVEAAILVDAVAATATPPRLWRFAAHQEPLPADLFPPASSHTLGLPQVIELGRALGRLPPVLIAFGIAGERFGLGEEPSPGALQALPELVAALQGEITGFNQDADSLSSGGAESCCPMASEGLK